MNDRSVSIARYCIVFSLVYTSLLFVLNIFTSIADVGMGHGVSTGIAIAAVCGSVAVFVKDQGRPPNKSERRKLACGSVAASLFISLTSLFLVMFFSGESPWGILSELLNKVTPILFGVALVMITLIYYLFLSFCYWWIGKIAVRVHVKS